MTAPLSYFATQIVDIQQQVADLKGQKVTYMQVPVTSINTGASTFGVTIPANQAAGGAATPLTGIPSPAQFMPSVGQDVVLAVAGAQVVYQPTQVAPGTITATHLSPDAPSAPTTVSLSTTSTIASDGTSHALINAAWHAPTTTVGGATLTSTLTYMVQFRATGSTVFIGEPSTTLSASLKVQPATPYDVQIAAVDQLGNVGAYTAINNITSAADTAPPATPSTPTVGNYLGQLKITWDGLLGGAAPPPDFAWLEVHVSATTGFTPSSATLVSQLTAAGSAYATATYATTMFAKFIAVDTTGNRSTASTQGSGSTSQVVSADIFAGAVGTSQLANLAVTTAKINNLAVNDAQIGNMAVGKLTAGTMSVDVVMGGRFCTALTGARVEMNSTGFQKYDSGGNLIVDITGTNTLLNGTFKTNTTGRRIEILSAGSTGSVDFYGASSIHSWVQSRTETWSPFFEAINMGLDVGGHGLYNRVNIDNIPQIRLDSAQLLFAFTDAGNWIINQYTNSSSFTTGQRNRMVVDNTGMSFHDPTGLQWLDQLPGNANRIRFSPTGLSNGTWEIGLASGSGESLRTYYFQSGGGGGMFKTGASTFQCRDTGDTTCIPIFASAFNVSPSDANAKTSIIDADVAGLASKFRALRVRQYRRVAAPDAPQNPLEIGLIAQESPAEIVAAPEAGLPGISLYHYVTLVAAGLQQGLTDTDALTARVAKLEAALSKGKP